MTSSNILYIVRHAESPSGSPDHERKLSSQGLKRANELGKMLAEVKFDVAFASSAKRVQQTLGEIKNQNSNDWSNVNVTSDKKYYEASVSTWVTTLNELGTEHKIVLFVGHNPVISQLATQLSGETISMSAGDCVRLSGATAWSDCQHNCFNEIKHL